MKLSSLIIIPALLITHCSAQVRPVFAQQSGTYLNITGNQHNPKLQVSQYISTLFEDSKGNLWLGTVEEGVCCFDGKRLNYYSTKEGLSGVAVRAIAEDKNGNIWIGSNGGLSKYDGKQFTNFTVSDGLPDNQIWSIMVDNKGTIWVGTKGGACRYNPASVEKGGSKRFKHFSLPEAAKRDYATGVSDTKTVISITEDNKGNIWFATNGAGVCCYNGKSLIHISEKDGLSDDFVQRVIPSQKGGYYFVTRRGGVCHYTTAVYSPKGKGLVTRIAEKGALCNDACWNGYEDINGNLWIASSGCGIYCYNGATFTNIRDNTGISKNHVQCLVQDKKGRMWFGFSGGLFRLDKALLVNITKNGPWQ